MTPSKAVGADPGRPPPPDLPSPVPPTFGRALGYWLKLGFIGFGGPAGQSR